MFIGIDLGTTSSAIAAFDGDAVSIIPNALGENLTPSVVRIDGRGVQTVGRKALRALDGDPGGTRAEWKRLMGTAEALLFEPAGRALLPEELSAEVLRSLLGDARDALGFAPRAAVISTPALFELPQNHATARAGKLAGLGEVVLIQEPIASAIAAGWRGHGGHSDNDGDVGGGLWMVYDLGGGTLDVSLLETRDGRLRVVDHAGDNFLGGKDMDGALVDWALAELGIALADRAAPAARRLLGRLKTACEQAKIELSRAERATIVVPDLVVPGGGATLDVDLPIARAQLDALVAPLVARSLAVVRGLLGRAHRSPDDVARLVLVGGPTLMPAVRGPVAALVGGRIAEGVDPMTAVARGAALYAGTAGLDARPAAPVSTVKAGLAVRIEHPAVTADLEPFVVGRFLPAAGEAPPDRVEVVREDERGDGGSWPGARAALSPEGSFVLQVKLGRGRQNRFRLRAFDRAGTPLALATSGFAIVHGISIADPPLSRSVGVACADNLTQVYLPKGTPLPARRTFVHHTAVAIAAGGAGEALAIPVVQGESRRAHRNRLIGVLRLAGLDQDLPAGSRVEVTLHLDRSGLLETRADVPAIGQTFEDVVHVLVPSATLETAERELATAGRRADDLQRRTFGAGAPAAVQALHTVPDLLAEAERCLPAARAGDPDAGQKLHRLLLDLGGALDDAEAILEWPDADSEAQRCVLYYAPLVAEWGTPAEQELFDDALMATSEARRNRNVVELERHLEALRALGRASFCRNPQSAATELEWAAAHVMDATDVARASRLIDEARAAERAGSGAALRALLVQLRDQFPGSPAEREKSFGSGVR